MKKVFILTFMMLSVVMTFAQETKRVAILETVDKQGNVSYATKLILRTNIAKAITGTPGYEAYDRTDIDAIMSEHDFQRTGLVSNDQIARLGEMTGAKYVLVTECALTSDEKMIVSVKLLNVETARVEMTDNALMLLSSEDIQQECKELAATLFSEGSAFKTPAITKINGKLQYKRHELDKDTYIYMLQTCSPAYKYYKNGKVLVYTGWGLFGGGFVIAGVGFGLSAMTNSNYGGLISLSIGACCIGTSIPLLSVGYHRKNNAYKIYNKKCASSSIPLTLNLTAGQNGLGIAMNF